MYIAGLLIVPLIVMQSCGAVKSEKEFTSSELNIINGLPFVKQEYQYCGPSALASVFGYYGKELDQHEIAEKVYTEELKGSLITDMKAYALEMGFDSSIENGDPGSLVSYIDQRVPVIVLVDRGPSLVTIQHFYVIYGYVRGKDYFVINDGNKMQRYISFKELKDQWKKMNNLMLVIKE